MKLLARTFLLTLLLMPAIAAQQSSTAPQQHGRRSLKIVRVEKPPKLDGRLDDEGWSEAERADKFVQKDPAAGTAATEKTEVRALYDDTYLYFGVKCFDGEVGGIRATELRRDNDFANDDSFSIILDTFHDHRNAFLFRTNPKGTQFDALVTEEGRDINESWDEKWDVETEIAGEGWIAEIRIPLSTIRFSAAQVKRAFGVDFERVIRRKNELTYWNSFNRNFSFNQVSQAGHLEGLAEVSGGSRLRVKPYVNARMVTGGTTDRSSTDFLKDVGLEDVKYQVTRGLTLDLTANTDFAQTEVDNQIINFDRVPPFFPEKRDFFLEGAGIFEFGVFAGEAGFRAPEARLYHTRRVGLSEDGRTIDILFGAKLSGKVGEKFTLGVLQAQTQEFETREFQKRPGDNFAIFRLKRDILTRSSVGVFFTNRQAKGGDYNRVVGMDQNLVVFQHLAIKGALARSFTDGIKTDDQWVGLIGADWTSDFFNSGFDYRVIDQNFFTDVGFLERKGVVKYGPYFQLSPRPRSRIVRQFQWGVRLDHFRTLEGNNLDGETYHFNNNTFFQNGSQLRASPHKRGENLAQRLRLPGGLTVPPGRYNWWSLPFTYFFNPARKLAGSVQYRAEPGYFGGMRHTWNLDPLIKLTSRFSADFSYQINSIRLAGMKSYETFHVMNNRFNFALSRKLLTSTLFQYSTTGDLIGVNFRLNYIYRPGDDLFVVFNEFRSGPSAARALDRAIIVKFTRSFDF